MKMFKVVYRGFISKIVFANDLEDAMTKYWIPNQTIFLHEITVH